MLTMGWNERIEAYWTSTKTLPALPALFVNTWQRASGAAINISRVQYEGMQVFHAEMDAETDSKTMFRTRYCQLSR